MLRKARIGLGFIILAISIIFLAWGYWPAHRELRVRPVSGAAGSAPDEQALTLLFPPRIRVGETAVVRLTLDVDVLTDLSAADDGTQTVIAAARFDLPGINVRPSELISAPISSGQTAVFYWTLRPNEVGKFRGTVWLYLRVVDKQTGQENRETLSAQIVEIESVKLLGLPLNRIQTIGFLGASIGLILCFPFFLIIAGIFMRKRR
jgi:hypothetical protein